MSTTPITHPAYCRHKTISENAKAMKVSVGTVWNWLHTDMSIEAQKQRLSKRGRKKKLTKEQEEEVVKWTRERAEKGEPTTGDDLIAHIWTLTQTFKPKKPYISKLCKRLKISSKRTIKQMRSPIQQK
jgi:transposase